MLTAKCSAQRSVRPSHIRSVAFIAAFALAVGIGSAACQAHGGVGHMGMGSRAGPRVGFGPHRGSFMGRGTPLTGFCDRSPFCVTGAASSPFGFGFGAFSPFLGAAGFSPWLGGGWGLGGGWDLPYASYGGSASFDNFQQQVADYLGNLRQEVQKLREDAERNPYSPPPKPAEPRIINVSFPENAPRQSVPPAVFVLKDGKRIEASRYVLTSDKLWVQRIGEPRQAIPVSELNVQATTNANQERGLALKVPSTRGEVFMGF